MKWRYILFILIFTLGKGYAQQADSTVNGMPLGMSLYKMAEVATLQHHPLPGEVLQYRVPLALSPVQMNKLTLIIKTLELKKAEVRQSVAMNEKMLQRLFATHKAQESNLIFYGNRYGLYEGEMRTAVLVACVATAQLLTPLQLTKFEDLQKQRMP